jgi:hypothetical protein
MNLPIETGAHIENLVHKKISPRTVTLKGTGPRFYNEFKCYFFLLTNLTGNVP